MSRFFIDRPVFAWVVAIFIMLAVGYLIGYRFHGTLVDGGLMILFCVLVGLAFSWIAATIGLLVKDTQTAEIAGFTWVFPVVFLSSIFVPTRTMLDWLRPIAEHNPVTLAANATRGWSLGAPALGDAGAAVLWMVGIIAVFSTVAVWRFRRLA